MSLPTTCYACGASGDLADGKRCDCGEPRWLDVDPAGFEWPGGGVADPGWSLWRYADLLPVEEPGGVGAAAGGTPLVRAPRLDDAAGCRVHLKDEGENPTGSFKDRGSAVGVAWADRAGREWVGTVSHGNMAMSVAAHAAGHGLDCVVLVPADISADRLHNIRRFDPTVVRVEGDYGRLYHDALAAGPPAGVEFVNSDTPLRVAGQKTVALEVCEAFAPGVPDALVLPASSGGLASATWTALRELRAAGLVDALPPIYLVQTAACDPIARAYRRGEDRVERLDAPGETVAYSIANPDPPSGSRALAAVRETGGAVVAVDDDAILAARDALAGQAGFAVETASATTLAGAALLAERGHLGPDDDAALVLTGSGFKERETAGRDSGGGESEPGDGTSEVGANEETGASEGMGTSAETASETVDREDVPDLLAALAQ